MSRLVAGSAVIDGELTRDVSLGTTIIAVQWAGGVVLGADSRTSSGSYVANRTQDKITPLLEHVYLCRSGSASDTQAIAGYVQLYLAQHQVRSEDAGQHCTVCMAARMRWHLAHEQRSTSKTQQQSGLV